MLIAVASDVHGNRPALEAVIAAAEAAGTEELWCLGDLVGYGGEPDGCVELAKAHATVCLAGNHDLGVIGEISIEDFSPGARLAAEWTAEVIAPGTRAFLEALRPFQGTRGFGLFHASPRDPVWEYVLDTLTAELCLDSVKQPLNLIGHSHVALSFSRMPGEAATGTPRGAEEVASARVSGC
jgi:predicted phosphodiesterase